MQTRAYYNEIDISAAHVLRCLIPDGVIAPGDVDTRSIKEVKPDDLMGYAQCHFFAGGGLWSVAARLAGWPDDKPLWTGSCPCQPFSQAGQGRGVADERHLWPEFHQLIAAVRPPVVVGEQVAGKAGYGWLDESALIWEQKVTPAGRSISGCGRGRPQHPAKIVSGRAGRHRTARTGAERTRTAG